MTDFGLTLTNRGVVTGDSSLEEMYDLTRRVDDDERRSPRHEVPVRRLEGRGLRRVVRHRLPLPCPRASRCGEPITRPGKV